MPSPRISGNYYKHTERSIKVPQLPHTINSSQSFPWRLRQFKYYLDIVLIPEISFSHYLILSDFLFYNHLSSGFNLMP